MTQNSKSQRGQIFYEEYGEVGLKVPLSRKSHDFQAISAPPTSWRSSFRKFRKNLSRPEIQVRIFLSIILIFGGVLLTGYATNEVVFESGANRTLKIFWVNAYRKWRESKKSKNSGAGANNDPERSDGEESNTNKKSGTLWRIEPVYGNPMNKETTYDIEEKVITNGSHKFEITDETFWMRGEEGNDYDLKQYYDLFFNAGTNQLIYLKKPKNPKHQDVVLMQTIRDGVKEENKIGKETVDLSGIMFSSDEIPESGGTVLVYNNELRSMLPSSETDRAKGRIEGSSARGKGIISYEKMSVTVPALKEQSELQLLFQFWNMPEKQDYQVNITRTDGNSNWESCTVDKNVFFYTNDTWKCSKEEEESCKVYKKSQSKSE